MRAMHPRARRPNQRPPMDQMGAPLPGVYIDARGRACSIDSHGRIIPMPSRANEKQWRPASP
eukprot:11049202-Lingulodinium_polyedra.AAC.1